MKTPEEPSLEEKVEALSEYMDVAQKRILALETRVMELREDLIFTAVNLEKTRNWTRVSDRLPECGQWCVWIHVGGDTYASPCIEQIDPGDSEPWWEIYSHWMPAPESKVKEKE